MSWKDLPYWIKGGLTGFLIGIVLSIFFIILVNIMPYAVFIYAVLNFLTLPMKSLFFSSVGNMSVSYSLVSVIFLPIESLIIGVVTGLVIGKIKSKKQI